MTVRKIEYVEWNQWQDVQLKKQILCFYFWLQNKPIKNSRVYGVPTEVKYGSSRNFSVIANRAVTKEFVSIFFGKSREFLSKVFKYLQGDTKVKTNKGCLYGYLCQVHTPVCVKAYSSVMPQMIGTDTYGTTEEYGAWHRHLPSTNVRRISAARRNAAGSPGGSSPRIHSWRTSPETWTEWCPAGRAGLPCSQTCTSTSTSLETGRCLCLPCCSGYFRIGAAMVSQRHRFCHCNPCTVLHCTTSRWTLTYEASWLW